MTTSIRRPVAALLAAATLLAACGDSGDGGGGDAPAAEGEQPATDATTPTADTGGGHGHDHRDLLEIPEGMAVPEISINVEADPKSGHNLFVELADFDLAPEHASTEPVDGEGHLHLYIDGVRVLRFYNRALHLADLAPGEHDISVEVSANNHAAYAVDGEAITASQKVTVAGGEHTHGAIDPVEFEGDRPPTVDVAVAKDPKSGWNLSASLGNFTITPEAASTEPVDGEGHLHLYIDGQKVTRLYGPDWHIAELNEGSHLIEVELSHNNHAAYAIDGEPIRASAAVEVSADEATDAGGTGEAPTAAGTDETTDADGVDAVIEVTVADGGVVTEQDRVEVAIGSTVSVIVESDTADEVHIHGFDVFGDVAPGAPAEIVFVADVPGVFEVELEGSGTFLFEIQVS